MPQLDFFAGLWTLRGYPSAECEWSLDRKFEEVKSRGFSTIGGRFLKEAPVLCRRLGLEYVLYVDAGPLDYEEQLHRARDWAPRRINVQLCEHDTSPEEAADCWIRIMQLAEALGLPIDLEVHRATATETPEKAAMIAQRVLQATGEWPRFCLDCSHPAVVKQLAPPYAERLLPSRELLARVRQFHARPFNGHHAQIPVTTRTGELTPEVRPYLDFLEAFVAAWRAENPGEATLLVCPENGPREGGYALSCFPDVWEDAVRIREELKRIWERQTAGCA